LRTWSDSSAWQRLTTHCKLDKSGHSGTRLGDSSTSALLSEPCPIELPPLPLSLQLSPITLITVWYLINQVIRHLFIFLFIILFGSNLILFGID
jgi:hypothetical protein